MSKWLSSFAIEWPRDGGKDAALDLMMRVRGILNVDDEAVVSVSEHEATPSETAADEPHR
ncbi:MAG TPA: hypothetical protein VE667_10030 [Xanthobacteraceae bacterium]|nr:hypothetical protein [Xanthobacteraceae bacterium]